MSKHRIYVCHGPTCSAQGRALLQFLEGQIWSQGLEERLEAQSGGCLGHCEQGPNLVIYPGPIYHNRLTRESIRALVAGYLQDEG